MKNLRQKFLTKTNKPLYTRGKNTGKMIRKNLGKNLSVRGKNQENQIRIHREPLNPVGHLVTSTEQVESG